jgi:hypothetical protein
MMKINIYCDESGHLEKDNIPVMVLGALWCDQSKAREIAMRLREIKAQHGMPSYFEAKWTKISPAQKNLYLSLLDYFFDDDDLHFRAVVAPDKSKLDHTRFNQTHDIWYYKMYFELLQFLIDPEAEHYIYLDIKDTRGGIKVNKLHEVLTNNIYDFDLQIIKNIQQVQSHQVEQIQLTDLLIGAISYANRGLTTNEAKVAFVERFRQRSGHKLTRSTLLRDTKVNILVWQAS